MNPLMQLFGGGSSTGNASGGVDFIGLLMQMVGAAIRGESPQAFMKKLANQHPMLKKRNLDDLMGTAKQLADEKGVDINDLTKKLDDTISPMLPK